MARARAPRRRPRRHRGADARPRAAAPFPPGIERAAADARPPDVARRDLRDAADVHDRPRHRQDFDDAISCKPLGDEHWRVWVHIADVTAYVRPGGRWTARPTAARRAVYVPGAVEPMLPEALSNDACSLAPGSTPGGQRRDGDARRGAVEARLPPLADPLRRAPGLRPGRPHLRRRGGAEEPLAEPLAAARAAAAALQARREAAARWSSRGSSRSSPSTGAATGRGRGDGPDRVAPADRAPDDRRQRGGGTLLDER